MHLYRRLFAYIKPYSRHLIGSILCAAMVSAMTAGYAYLVRPLMDEVFIRKDEQMLILVPVVTVIVAFLKGVFTYGQAYLMRFAASWIISDIRKDLYKHMLFLPVSYHTGQPTGELISRIIHDVQVMQSAVSTVVKDIFQQSLTLIGLIGVIFYQDWQLAWLALVVLPIMTYPIVLIGYRLKKVARKGQEKAGDLTNTLQETFSGIRIVKAFGKEGFESDRFTRKNAEYYKTVVRAVAIGEITSPLVETILSVAIALILWYGGSRVISGEMTVGTFFSFIAGATMMYAPIKSLSRANNNLQQALASAERVFSVIDMRHEQVGDAGKQVLERIKGNVSFKNVSFAYSDSKASALSDINIEAKTGEIIALVGSSGAGKSTLITLIPRFYDVDQGEILMDNIPINTVSLASLRKQIGIVSQEIVLFDGSIRWNIAYGAADATEAQILAAAEAAYADDFINQLPEGYDTLLEKGGANLSGGQRQRIAIARALLKDPPILILDEATSALDTESEFVVRKALEKLMKNRTTFVIAHRLSTIQQATSILVIDHGRIVERGTHEALLRKDGPYKKVYRMQFREN